MPKWMEFRLVGQSESGKTYRWEAIAKEEGIKLGEVRWFGSWRKYCFFPLGGTVFEQDCLRDIAQFCESQTKEQRSKK